MSKAAEITSLMIMGAVVACCLGVVGFVINFTLWYPDKPLSPQVWGFAGGAWTILTVLGGAIINNVLSSRPVQQANPPSKS
jgi:hypothetical protein